MCVIVRVLTLMFALHIRVTFIRLALWHLAPGGRAVVVKPAETYEYEAGQLPMDPATKFCQEKTGTHDVSFNLPTLQMSQPESSG